MLIWIWSPFLKTIDAVEKLQNFLLLVNKGNLKIFVSIPQVVDLFVVRCNVALEF